MQPLGRKPVRFPSKRDWHITGFMNWWERLAKNNITRGRQAAKSHINKEIQCVNS